MTDDLAAPAAEGGVAVSADLGTTMRACGRPACARKFDIAAHMAGEFNAGPWLQNRLVRYLCPDHRYGEHVPDWELHDECAVPVCSCRWQGKPARIVAGAAEQWREHVLAAT